MNIVWDLIIIGAGPAGMSAALEAAARGVSVLVLDRQADPGGQIFRNVGKNTSAKNAELGADYAKGRALVHSFMQSSAVFYGEANVWHLTPGRVYAGHPDGSRVHAARNILVATGGMERPVPVPGWTLPGVMGAGACDILLKSASLAPAGSVILCGNGPLILQTAVHLKHFAVPVAGVVLTGDMANYLKMIPRAPGALARPLYLAHGVSMGLRTFWGTKWYPASKRLRIDGGDGDFTVTFDGLGKRRELRGGTVLLHEGVIPETRITRLARVRHAWNAAQRCWHAETDLWGATNLPGMFAAGDCAGVLGADAAPARGRLAALRICRELDVFDEAGLRKAGRKYRRVLWRSEKTQAFLDAVFSASPRMLQPDDAATVCRCEELTAADLKKTIRAGCYSLDGLKAQARPGMGACQGRMCASAAAEMIAQVQGIPLENLQPYHAQAPLFPLRLGELADMDIPPEL